MVSQKAYFILFLLLSQLFISVSPQCCCSTMTSPHPIQTTDYTFAKNYLLAYLSLNVTAKAMIKRISKLPAAMSVPLFAQYLKFNRFMSKWSSYPIDNVYSDFLNYCVDIAPKARRLTEASALNYSAVEYFPFPYYSKLAEQPQISPNNFLDQTQLNLVKGLDVLAGQSWLESSISSEDNQDALIVYFADGYQTFKQSQANQLLNYYCARGYSAWFTNRITQIANNSPDGIVLIDNLMSLILPTTAGLDRQFFVRWVSYFLWAQYENQGFSGFICEGDLTNCDNSC